MTITGDDLTRMRDLAAGIMPDRVTIQRATDAADGFGGTTHTWATVKRVQGRMIGVAKAAPAALAGADLVTYELVVPAGADVRRDDRLVVAGVTYRVADVVGGHTWEVQRRVFMVVDG